MDDATSIYAMIVLSHIHNDCDACVTPIQYNTKNSEKYYWLERSRMCWQSRVIPFRIASSLLYDESGYIAALQAGYRIALSYAPLQEAKQQTSTSQPLWIRFLANRLYDRDSNPLCYAQSEQSFYRLYLETRSQHHRSESEIVESICMPFPFRGLCPVK